MAYVEWHEKKGGRDVEIATSGIPTPRNATTLFSTNPATPRRLRVPKYVWLNRIPLVKQIFPILMRQIIHNFITFLAIKKPFYSEFK